jgi:hypothetical protein
MKESKNEAIEIKANDSIHTYYDDEIWGYREKGIDWRLNSKQSYQIDYYDEKICLYTIPGTAVPEIPDWSYFSTGLTAPIYDLSRKNLKAVFHSDTAFVRRINNLPTTKSIFKWDKKKDRYAFISWLTNK